MTCLGSVSSLGCLNVPMVLPTWARSGVQRKSFLQLAIQAFSLISQFFCKLNSSKYFTCPLGKLRTEFTSLIAKSTYPALSNTTFFARWSRHPRLDVEPMTWLDPCPLEGHLWLNQQESLHIFVPEEWMGVFWVHIALSPFEKQGPEAYLWSLK